MIQNKRGRPPNSSNRNFIKEILDEIDDDNPIRLKDLRNKVKMSSATLVKYLDYLHLIGAIDKKPVKSLRGKGMEYSKSRDAILPWDKMIEKQMNFISNIPNVETTNLKSKREYAHAYSLCLNIVMINLNILQFLKLYAESEKEDQKKILETYNFLIKGMIKELTQFTSVPIETMNISIDILNKAFINPKFIDCIDDAIE